MGDDSDVKGFIAGWFAGCAALIVSHPIDTVKVRKQTQSKGKVSSIQCFMNILKGEKVRGLFKGMTCPLLGQGAINATVFGVEVMVYSRLQKADDKSLSIRNSVIAGICAGSVQTVIVSPMELIKIRMQTQSIGQPHISWTMQKLGVEVIPDRSYFKHYQGPLQTTRDILCKDGMRGMFKGWWLTYLREAPQFGIYFGSYAWIRTKIAEYAGTSPEQLGVFHLSLAGGITGVVTWLWYPVDVIKSRFQGDSAKKYTGVLDCMRKSVRHEGVGVFVKGLQPTLIRGFFNGLVTFPVFTLTMHWLNGKFV